MKHGYKVLLNSRNKFSKRVFPNVNIFLPILNKLEEPRFCGKQEKSTKLKGLETWIHSKIGGR
jgi:hypothetical protein